MRACSLAALVLVLLLPVGVAGQADVDTGLMQEVFPGATRYAPPSGKPPVIKAYGPHPTTGKEALLGYLFLTSDWPPEESGYNSTIETLVGMDTQGQITGARVIEYHESLRSSRGDFLRGRFEDQFSGKRIGDPFRIRRDVDNVSGATISTGAAARGIRNAARRVASVHMRAQEGEVAPEEIAELDWPDLVMRGLGDRLTGIEKGLLRIEVYLVPLADEAMGRTLIGDAYDTAVQKLGERSAQRSIWMVGVDGGLAALFRVGALTILRGGDTLRFTAADIALTGEPRSGKVDAQFRNVGLILVDPTVDPRQKFTWRLDFGGGMQAFTLEHQGERTAVAAAPPAESAAPDPTTETAVSAEAIAPADIEPADMAPVLDPLPVDFTAESEETVLQRTIAQTHWVRVGLLVFLLTLASAAFFSKLIWLRWAALGATLLIMGFGSAQATAQFGGGGFLSVSHITSGIKVGPGVYLEDLPLLLLVTFTVATTLLWGRVFCGYLCPFGALQDFMEHLVPKKLRRKFQHPVHESGLYLKYGVLGVILVPAIAGSNVNIFQYFEPFGTVFFWSSSTVLWIIAGAVLVASAVIPRFYCRYMCPLGAALALASLISPFRIKRVRHCTICTVCEHTCPTGAIQRESIDFRECVRCNACEVKLIRRAGVCRHDLNKVSHLLQIKRGRRHLPFPRPEAVNGD